MKNFFVLIGLVLLINSCGGVYLPDDDPTPSTPNVSGQWTTTDGGGGGFTNFDSFKNFQYSFEIVGNNKRLDIDLESLDINLNYMIFTPLGKELFNRGSSDRVFSEYIDQLSAGTYRLVVTADRRAVGRFSLKTTGTKSGLTRIASQILKSNTQNWGPLGGGGIEKSFKNHFYTFDITQDNTSVDIELESPDTDGLLYLYDEFGERIVQERGDRYEYILRAAKRGTYTVMVGSNRRGDVGNYRLNIFGKVANFKKVASEAKTVMGRWANKDAKDIYTLRVTTNNSTLDAEVLSADTNVDVEVQNSVGDRISASTGINKSNSTVSKPLPSGTYRVEVSPRGNGFGNYTLHVHGQFTDFKKL